jgi:glycosyltransferase involved in cell wall biosynthesis
VRVAFLIRSLNRGGAERQLAELAKGLRSMSWDVTVLTFYPGGPIWNELSHTVRLQSLDKGGRWDIARFSASLGRALHHLHPSVLHCFMVEPSIFGLAAGRLARVPAIVWGVRASDMELSRYDRATEWSFAVAARLSPLADLIIANSEAGRRYHIARGYPRRRFLTIVNGIDGDRFRPSKEVRALTRRSWGITDDQFVVGIAARLDPMKGYETFLRAAAAIVDRRVRFVCVGGGPAAYANQLHGLALELGLSDRVLWVGECEQMADVYPAFDLGCSASSFGEGFSNAVAEAMACGVPYVVTDVGDSSSIVGDTGMVVPRRNPDALRRSLEAMIALGSEARAALARAARERVTTHFDVRRMIQATADAYRNVLESRNTHG